MKNIAFFLLVLIFVSCSSNKGLNIVNDDTNEPKYILVFMNNFSKKSISDEVKNLILNTEDNKNRKNLVFHTEKKDDINYDYGLELIINSINILENKSAPKTYKKEYNAYNNRQLFDNETRVNGNKISSIEAGQINLIEYRVSKNCRIEGKLNFININSGELIFSKEIKSETNFSKVYNTTQEEGFLVGENKNKYDDLSNVGIMRNEIALKNYKIVPQLIKNDLFLPTDQEIAFETILKLKNDYSKFISQI